MPWKGLEVCQIAAMARTRVIGRDGDMPWRIHADFKHFKQTTMGKPMIMGRKTFESLPGLLPGRTHIVVTRKEGADFEGALTAQSLEDALDLAVEDAKANGQNQIMVIGGGEIYALALAYTDRIFLTEIAADVEGDTRFPDLDPAEWREIRQEAFPDDPKASYPAVMKELERG